MWYKVPRWIKRKEYTNERYNARDYMNVYFFDSYEEMYESVDKLEGEKIERDYTARCYSVLQRYVITDDETGEEEFTDRYSPNCGNMYFVIDKLGMNTVSHECLHATLGYFSRKIKNPKNIIDTDYDVDSVETKKSDCEDMEELVCYMHGGLVEQVFSLYANLPDN